LKKIEQQMSSGEALQLDLTALSKGVYFLTIQTEESRMQEKLVIQ
jgi:hypothetical protein